MTSSRTPAGIWVGCFQLVPRAYDFPADRANAPRACTTKYGWFSRRAMNRCPTVPVAPSTPTLTFLSLGTTYMGGRVTVRTKQKGCLHSPPKTSSSGCVVLTSSSTPIPYTTSSSSLPASPALLLESSVSRTGSGSSSSSSRPSSRPSCSTLSTSRPIQTSTFRVVSLRSSTQDKRIPFRSTSSGPCSTVRLSLVEAMNLES